MDSDKITKSSLVAEGLNLVAQGKRNLVCKEIHQAVLQLGEATQTLAQECGDMAVECADAYFTYGRALLELHRSECSVLGDAIPNENNEEDDDDDDEEEEEEEEEEGDDGDVAGGKINGGNEEGKEENIEDDGQKSEDLGEDEDEKVKIGENLGNCVQKHEKKTDDNDADKDKDNEIVFDKDKDKDNGVDKDKDDGVDEVVLNESKQTTNAAANEAASSKEEPEGAKQTEDNVEDISNLQVAWEVFELAKLIYSKDEAAESALKLAETYFKLGDVGLESEQFGEAIQDYEACLGLQLKRLPEDSRLVAETHYQLGLAHSLKQQCKPAIDHFLACIQVMQVRVGRLERVVSGDVPPLEMDQGDGFYTPLERASNEVKELKELINEVYLKIEEVRDEEKEAPEVSEMMSTHLSPSKQPPPDTHHAGKSPEKACLPVCESPQKTADKVNNITHLVRKKRKIDKEENGHDDNAAKKAKHENDVDKK